MPRTSTKPAQSAALPVLPLRDVVVYPNMVIPLFVGRERSMEALEAAMEGERQLVLVAQKDPQVDDPQPDQLYGVGTLVNILQLLKLPDDTVKVLVEGEDRVTIDNWHTEGAFLAAEAHPLESDYISKEKELNALVRTLMSLFEQLVKQSSKLPPEVVSTLSGIEDPSRLADSVAAHLSIKLAHKQQLLETLPVAKRLEMLIGFVDGEMDLQKVEKRIRGRVKSQMEKSQREYYLNEQMKAIQKELGDSSESGNETDKLAKKIAEAQMPKEVLAKAQEELGKLRAMSPMSAEASVVRNYLEWLIAVPWQKSSTLSDDLRKAEKTLDADHYGLEKVKERILEYLAVQKRVKSLNGPILCLVGPPGVGKTSLGQSIANASNRKFVRMSLGGVRDEAEIRGHRRTYIGSMPGRIVQNLKKCGTNNPLFMLDEIDKMAMDFRGDPASALLEVLDPEQNKAFNDHYLEVDVDLSKIMWIATANSLNIPDALRDRMEIIRLPGYTEDEKLAIAKKYLVRKQRSKNGLEAKEISISTGAIRNIIRYYTREAGVRNLEREIATICRKVVRELALSGSPDKEVKEPAKTAKGAIKVDVKNLDKYLGVRRFDFGRKAKRNEVGLVTGLAWTQVGGELLSIECSVMPGKGKLVHTGQLGDVMKESIMAAQSVVRARSERLGIAADFHEKHDIHVHVPEGATPKDGPSAGIGMCTALVSTLTGIPVRSEVAMTGEITLRGRVLPIGGLKEKLLAAHRGGITTVIIPEDNRKDLVEIPDNVTKALDIHPVRWIDEVLDLALESPVKPKKASQKQANLMAQSTQSNKSEKPGASQHAH